MVNASPQSLTTLFVVSVTVMAFFTTGASTRIENIESPNTRFLGAFSLIASYVLLFYMGILIMNSGAFVGYEAIFSTMKVVFVAFIIPGFILLKGLEDVIEDAWNDPDFSLLWTVLGGLLIALTYIGIMSIAPPT